MSEPAPDPGRRRGLGRGLELLVGPTADADTLVQLPIGAIRPNRRQPRRRLDAETISELAESIRVQGVVQPVIARVDPAGGYELIAGERRWRAARAAAWQRSPPCCAKWPTAMRSCSLWSRTWLARICLRSRKLAPMRR